MNEILERLLEALNRRFPPGHGSAYITSDNLRLLLDEVLHPATVTREFPLMLYLGGSRNDFMTVGSVEEKLKAERLGYITTPNAQYGPDYPQSWVETPASGRGSDLRRVLLRDADEQKRFDELTRKAHWQRDDALEFGGRGIGLSELVSEKEIELQQVVHDQLHGIAPHAEGADADQGR